jgi:prepilin-type N-terminal cleavage/methylation domain-containing protein
MFRRADDRGFTLVEVLVAAGLIGSVLIFSTAYFVGALSMTRYQSDKQAAAQLATDAMDRMRSMPGSTLATGRDAGTVTSQLRRLAHDGVLDEAIADIEPAVDLRAVTGAGRSAPLPTVTQPVTVHGLTFGQDWLLGRCWVLDTGGDCTVLNKTQPNPVELLRVVVAITWTGRECPDNRCLFTTSTLVDSTIDEPFLDLPTPTPTAPPAPLPSPTIPAPTSTPTPAPTALPAAIWANRSTDGAGPAAFTVDRSLVTITGVVHSNSDISLSNSVGSISPKIEYGSTLTKDITALRLSTPAGARVAPGTPDHRDFDAYRPGGSAALAAGAGYRQISCSRSSWTYSAADVRSATVVYVPCDVTISDLAAVNALIVATGTISVSGSLMIVGDPAHPGTTGLLSDSSSTTAISIGGSATRIYGSVQALRGGVVVTGSAASLFCGLIGDTVTIKGNAISITVDDSCTG